MEASTLRQVLDAVKKQAVNETTVCVLKYEVNENQILLWSEEKRSPPTGIFYHREGIEDILTGIKGWDAFYTYYESKKHVVAVLFDTTKF